MHTTDTTTPATDPAGIAAERAAITDRRLERRVAIGDPHASMIVRPVEDALRACAADLRWSHTGDPVDPHNVALAVTVHGDGASMFPAPGSSWDGSAYVPNGDPDYRNVASYAARMYRLDHSLTGR